MNREHFLAPGMPLYLVDLLWVTGKTLAQWSNHYSFSLSLFLGNIVVVPIIKMIGITMG